MPEEEEWDPARKILTVQIDELTRRVSEVERQQEARWKIVDGIKDRLADLRETFKEWKGEIRAEVATRFSETEKIIGALKEAELTRGFLFRGKLKAVSIYVTVIVGALLIVLDLILRNIDIKSIFK